ncbi:DUF397 domain-containing protein [Streptomyces sp. ALI-76-A]|jgi:hypothetical protein|uniref:DUF397 domain-containing protein n=1 Tax=Streptomyces sp. ALI-76-A TaxID=3025736 RepID=UPI00256F0D85|nr:DUF397 domain-containing protein [Streptomyces sp. ALI-76-A]MDL5202162.1 DUF397 domain-containing protein [Streptomyces sp. ALI-76-A]
MIPALEWFKSSYSGNDGPDCVEVAIAPADATVHVRDSKDKNGTRLAFTDASWAGFVAFARR